MTGLLVTALLTAAGALGVTSDADVLVVSVASAPRPSIWTPPQQRGMTRVQGTIRPFLGLTGNTVGALNDACVEHYFRAPFMLGLELSPVALAYDPRGTGLVSHVRLRAAYVTDYLAVGFAFGQRFRRFGTDGISLGPTLRLGALDGLNLELSFGHTIARNDYTGAATLGFSNLLGTITVPLNGALALQLDTGLSFDVWAFAMLGLRHRLAGDGGAGTWFVSGAFGLAWIGDRTACDYEATVPCAGNSALTFGPSVSFGLERRF